LENLKTNIKVAEENSSDEREPVKKDIPNILYMKERKT
jgi:hypothetical protein